MRKHWLQAEFGGTGLWLALRDAVSDSDTAEVHLAAALRLGAMVAPGGERNTCEHRC